MIERHRGLIRTAVAFTALFFGVTAGSAATTSGEIQPFTSDGHVIGFSELGCYVSNGAYALRVKFEGARAVTPVAAGQSTETATNRKAPAPLERVTYTELWKGVDATYDATGGILRSTWSVAPGGDPAAIRLRYNQPVQLTEQGELGIRFQAGILTESRPIAWQEIAGKRQSIEVGFVQLEPDLIGFTLGDYRRDLPVTIDPTLTWNTFFGENDNLNYSQGIAADNGGNVYVTGFSTGSWGSPVRPHSGGGIRNAFVARLSAAGELTWNTFLGADVPDEPSHYGIAVDGSSNVYVTGASTGTWGSPVRLHSGGRDAFVARLSGAGELEWNTFLGGDEWDYGGGIAVDGSGDVYVTGASTGTWGSPVRLLSGGIDAFVARLSGATGVLDWNTFLGRESEDSAGGAIAVDGSGNVYVTGASTGTWGSPVRLHSGGRDAFVARLSGSTGVLEWNTFLGGGNSADGGQWHGIAVDGSGNVYVTGASRGTWGTPVRLLSGDFDVFVARLSGAGELEWNTFLGGDEWDYDGDIAVDAGGNVYVTGGSTGTWGSPVRLHSDASYSVSVGTDAFVARLSGAGELEWNTFLGGDEWDYGVGIAVDGSGDVYVTGDSSNTWGSPVHAFSGGGIRNNAFVAKLPAMVPTAMPTSTLTETPTIPAITPIDTPTATATGTRSATPTPFCGDGNIDPGEECEDGNDLDGDCCNAACQFEPAASPCEDGDPTTCPDHCDGSGACESGHNESPECPNTCCDGVDNDGNGTFDLEDPKCGLGKEARFALIATSDRPKAIKMGGRVEVDSLDIRVDRLDCDETYVYRSKAGVCGEAMSYLRGGEAGFIATLAGNGQITFFGGGFDIRSHWVSDGAPESLKGEIPLVGPGICSIGGEGCSQPLTPLGGEACSSDSAGACCSDRSAVCQERKNLDDPSNLHVYRAGDHADYQSCQQLQTQLGADAAAVAALAPNHADYSNIQTPQKIRLRAQKIASPSHCEMGQPDACSAACAASCTVMLGAGQQVLYLDSVDVGKSTELRLCRDFGLSESDPPTVAIVRIEKNLKLGGGGKITACGVPPDRILWNAEGARGAVKLSAKASLAGTILAPGRRSVTVGGGARIDGSLYTQKVAFKKDAKLFHYPFSAGVE